MGNHLVLPQLSFRLFWPSGEKQGDWSETVHAGAVTLLWTSVTLLAWPHCTGSISPATQDPRHYDGLLPHPRSPDCHIGCTKSPALSSNFSLAKSSHNGGVHSVHDSFHFISVQLPFQTHCVLNPFAVTFGNMLWPSANSALKSLLANRNCCQSQFFSVTAMSVKTPFLPTSVHLLFSFFIPRAKPSRTPF